MQELASWFRLAVAQLGARATLRLLEVYQHPEAIFAATPREWTARARLSASGTTRLLAAINRDVSAELARMQRLGIRLIPLDAEDYPAPLRAIPDPPCVLFVKGELLPEDIRAVGIVGSRRASPYGRHVAAELAAGLAQRGVTVVSGMALGADAAAHDGTLRAGGRTLAVLGSGVDVIYPPEHAELYARIAAQGAIISENPPGSPPTRVSFPARNRIISGLSQGIVVVEAPEKSGALITATHALEQGREVFAVPGSVNSVQSRGSHQLLRDGAKLVESVDDILEDLQWPEAPAPRTVHTLTGPNWEAFAGGESAVAPPPAPAAKPKAKTKAKPTPPPPPPAAPPAVNGEEGTILALLSTTARHADEIIAASGLPPAQVNAGLLMLELKGLAQRRPGNLYVRM